MRRGRVVLLATAAVGLVLGSVWLPGCVHPPRREAPVPPPLEIRAPAHLTLEVTEMARRPLPPGQLTPPQRAGYRWTYQLRFSDTGGVGVRLEEVRMTVRSLSGIRADGSQPLPSRVEAHGSVPISLEAFLATSSPDEPGDLVGVHELTFLGTDDRGQSIQIEVRVPLE